MFQVREKGEWKRYPMPMEPNLKRELREQRKREKTKRASWVFLAMLCGSALASTFFSVQALEMEHLRFDAYDCTNPKERKMMIKGVTTDCGQLSNHTIVSEKDGVEVVVLQEAQHHRHKGYSCSHHVTRLAHYCGSYGQYFLPQMSKVMEYRELSAQDCRNMWENKEMMGYDGLMRKLEPGKVHRFKYEPAGATMFKEHYVTCLGSRVDWEGKSRGSINMYQEDTVLIKEVDLLIDEDDYVMVEGEQKKLPCRYNKEECQSASGTYYWTSTPSHQRCDYYKARTTVGRMITTTDHKVFVSTDGSMVHAVLGHTKTVCGGQVYTTSHDRMYLTFEKGNPSFQRPLHTDEMSVGIYSNMKDQYLHHEWKGNMALMVTAVVKADCERKKKKAGSQFAGVAAEQQVISQGDTAPLGDGWFITAAGEVWHRYLCQSVKVTYRPTESCYVNLPVQLDAQHELEYKQRRLLSATSSPHLNRTQIEDINARTSRAQFFVEPISRRLTTLGTPVECRKYFPTAWMNSQGEWLNFNPQPALIPTPEVIPADEALGISMPDIKDPDFDQGIYTPEQLLQMDRDRQRHGMEQDMLITVADDMMTRGRGGTGTYRPGDFFRSLEGMDWDMWAPFWAFLEKWNRVMLLLVTLFVLYKITFEVFEFFWRLRVLSMQRPGRPGRNFVEALIPAVVLNTLARLVNQGMGIMQERIPAMGIEDMNAWRRRQLKRIRRRQEKANKKFNGHRKTNGVSSPRTLRSPAVRPRSTGCEASRTARYEQVLPGQGMANADNRIHFEAEHQGPALSHQQLAGRLERLRQSQQPQLRIGPGGYVDEAAAPAADEDHHDYVQQEGTDSGP